MEQTIVFRAGEHGVSSMRIPGLVTSIEGTLLAFCEARDGGDRTPTDLVLKRSEDGGRTWGPLQLVAKARGLDAIMNPCPVVDASTGAIHCFSNTFPGGDWDCHREPGRVRTIVSRSDDDGLSWSSPEDITEAILDVSSDYGKVTGPGAGIQTGRGRLVIPFGLGPEERCQGMIVYSDDHGSSWHAGGRTRSTSSETQVVELSDGSLRLDMRNQGPEEKPMHCRCRSISRDGGQTWTEPAPDPGLVDVRCQGSILRYPFEVPGHDTNPILFANPASSYGSRVNMTVRLSHDDGRTWPISRTIHEGPSAYCCLAALPDGRISLLYEGGEERPYEGLRCAVFDLEWLTGS
jgi:sialidase-1